MWLAGEEADSAMDPGAIPFSHGCSNIGRKLPQQGAGLQASVRPQVWGRLFTYESSFIMH